MTPPAAHGPRSLLAMLAVYAGLTLVVVLGSSLAGAIARAPATELAEARPAGPEVLAFFGPLARGEPFDGWSIDRIDGLVAGGLLLALRGPAAQRVTVELRPADPRSPPSPAASGSLSIYLRDRESPPGALEGALALAAALRSREDSGARLTGLEPLLYTR